MPPTRIIENSQSCGFLVIINEIDRVCFFLGTIAFDTIVIQEHQNKYLQRTSFPPFLLNKQLFWRRLFFLFVRSSVLKHSQRIDKKKKRFYDEMLFFIKTCISSLKLVWKHFWKIKIIWKFKILQFMEQIWINFI